MEGFLSIYKREIKSYFSTPVAYVFLVIFLFFIGFLTFQNGIYQKKWLERSLLLTEVVKPRHNRWILFELYEIV